MGLSENVMEQAKGDVGRNLSEAERGDKVAKAVWVWLLNQKRVEYVPWVVDPASDKFDHDKSIEQQVRRDLLAELEKVIVHASCELT